jgi:twitching motility protein PilT
MPLVESLVGAIVQVDGDALVMHVGERPYVIASGGPIDVSSHPLDMQTMSRILAQLLSFEARRVFNERGAVEHELAAMPVMRDDRFCVVAARGADDLWVDIRRHRQPRPATAPSPPATGGAEVIPMTRPRLVEPVTELPRPVAAPRIERLLAAAIARGATTVYLTTDAVPFFRVDGEVRALDGVAPFGAAQLETVLAELAPEDARESLRRGEISEWTAEFPTAGRVNCSTFRDYRGLGAIFQLVSVPPTSAEHLGLTPTAEALATETDGLVLVATPRQEGKTTVAAAFVDFINRRRHCYVMTLERQIRVVHEQQKALISQRAMQGSGERASAIARAAFAENADVIVIDEVLSTEMWQLALDAAGSGALVIATVAATSCTSALKRIAELVPESRRNSMHQLLAARLRGAVAQVLLHRISGGRVPARELLLATSVVRSMIATGKIGDLPVAIERGRKHGLIALNESLVALVRSGEVDVREAYRKADDREGLIAGLKREGIDLSTVDRLA